MMALAYISNKITPKAMVHIFLLSIFGNIKECIVNSSVESIKGQRNNFSSLRIV